jgi:hypothetical protein
MNGQGELIVNASYKDFFLSPQLMRSDSFIFPNIEELAAMENRVLTRSIALFLKHIDSNISARYGIEIKTNGSERSSRIPLVRISGVTSSIWKITSKINSLEKAVVVLNELLYFLEEYNNGRYGLPKKVLILKEDETLFAKKESKYYQFVNDLIVSNDLFLFSFDYLNKKIKDGESVNFDSLVSQDNLRIFTLKS